MFEIKITSITKIEPHATDWATKIISLIDPDIKSIFPNRGEHHLVLAFEDTSNPKGFKPPTKNHVNKILRFCDQLTDNDRVLVHCHAGISRSTAAAIGILIRHGMSPEEAYNHVDSIRPQLWPNDLITSYVDEILGLNGKLVEVVKTKKNEANGLVFSTEVSPQEISDMKSWVSNLKNLDL